MTYRPSACHDRHNTSEVKQVAGSQVSEYVLCHGPMLAIDERDTLRRQRLYPMSHLSHVDGAPVRPHTLRNIAQLTAYPRPRSEEVYT